MTSLLPRASRLDDATADRLLATAVANVARDYPVHWTHLIGSADELVPQRALHPVFAGSYDWHSCVHQTWLAVRLLRTRPELPTAQQAGAVLDGLITTSACATEAEFFATNRHWERPYGRAWLFLLDAELRTWIAGSQDPTLGESAQSWAQALRPITDVLRAHWLDWAPAARWPTRVGTHANTAFASALVLDAARALGDEELAHAVTTSARRWYLPDEKYGGFEPDAADFLSPALVEADLMRRVLDADEFTGWFDAFLPDLDAPRWASLRAPVPVDDPSDPYGSHLAGLALSRAWNWRAVADTLPPGHRYVDLATTAAQSHAEAGWSYVFGFGYAAEHWLGTFAAYLDIGALS
jgi:hypothetical protein